MCVISYSIKASEGLKVGGLGLGPGGGPPVVRGPLASPCQRAEDVYLYNNKFNSKNAKDCVFLPQISRIMLYHSN